jgi:hypothetical protein
MSYDHGSSNVKHTYFIKNSAQLNLDPIRTTDRTEKDPANETRSTEMCHFCARSQWTTPVMTKWDIRDDKVVYSMVIVPSHHIGLDQHSRDRPLPILLRTVSRKPRGFSLIGTSAPRRFPGSALVFLSMFTARSSERLHGITFETASFGNHMKLCAQFQQALSRKSAAGFQNDTLEIPAESETIGSNRCD